LKKNPHSHYDRVVVLFLIDTQAIGVGRFAEDRIERSKKGISDDIP
jgi:hypothetical protein